MVRPHLRVRWPMPPPRLRPPTPVVEMMPAGTACPYSCVALSTSRQSAPPPTLTVCGFASTCTCFMRAMSMTRPSSQMPRPPALWPPPRMATGMPRSTPACTQATTSATSRAFRDRERALVIIPL